MDFSFYSAQLRDLRPDRSSGHAKPHKACLLLAVMDMIDRGQLTENRIEFGSALKEGFSERFERYKKGNDRDDPSQPFFYLTSSSFWHLEPNGGCHSELIQRLKEREHGSPAVITRLIKHAYVDNQLFDLMRNDVYRALLSAELETTLGTEKELFKQWCMAIVDSAETVNRYMALLKGVFGPDEDTGIESEAYEQRRQQYFEDLKKDADLGDEDACFALRLYRRYVKECYDDDMQLDLKEIIERQLEPTIRESLVKSRRGQGVFRARVLAQGNNRCAVTGYSDTRFLLASHIKPWRVANDKERLNRFNGLPLIPSIDRAFDIGLITFDTAGNILASPQLEEPHKLGITIGGKIDVQQGHRPFLDYHQSEIFVKA